jgi:hypothetical protein
VLSLLVPSCIKAMNGTKVVENKEIDQGILMILKRVDKGKVEIAKRRFRLLKVTFSNKIAG